MTTNDFQFFSELQNMAASFAGNAKKKQAEVHAEGSSGAGMITVRLRGDYKVEDITIEDSVWAMDDKNALRLLLISAMNNALENLNAELADKMASLVNIKP